MSVSLSHYKTITDQTPVLMTPVCVFGNDNTTMFHYKDILLWSQIKTLNSLNIFFKKIKKQQKKNIYSV